MISSAVVFLGAALVAGHPHATAPGASLVASPQPAPASGTWANIASPSMGRHLLAAAVGADGRVFASGGQDVNGSMQSLVEVYDPGSNTWSTVRSLPEARYGHASVSLNGLIYVIGGGGPSDWKSASTLVYNPSTDVWSFADSMMAQRYLPAATVAGGKIYVAGGWGTTGPLTSAEVYDPATGRWAQIANMNHARYFHALAAGSDGRVYAIGGYGTTFTPIASVEAYDPATNQWTDVASLPAARAELGAATGADGVIYAIGGVVVAPGTYLPVAQATMMAYDPSTNAWTDGPSMNQVRRMHGVAGGAGGTIYAINGQDGSAMELTSAEAFGTAPQAAPSVAVTIRVKSGDNASINRSAQGNVPVSVFSTGTFDATKIDRSTVTFAGAPAMSIGEAPADLNGDGLPDLMLHFSNQALSLPDGTTQACISGKTTDGKSFQGCDSVRLVK